MPGNSDLDGCRDQDRRGREPGKSPGSGPGDPDRADVRVGVEGRTSECPYCDGPGRERIAKLSDDSKDSQEAASSPTDLAWAAGLFDGEGNVWIGETGKVQLKVDMMSSEPVEALGRILGGSVGPWKHKNGHTVWRWRVSGSGDVLRVVSMLEGFCLEKQYELKLGKDVIKNTMPAMTARALVVRHREVKKNG